MKRILYILLIALPVMAQEVTTNNYVSFIVKHDERMANEDKLKYCTRQIWSDQTISDCLITGQS